MRFIKAPFHTICILCILLVALNSCKTEPERNTSQLFTTYCSGCHIAPKINELPKDIWKNHVLPDMRDRMEIAEMYQDPSLTTSGPRPKITLADWIALEKYILDLAPQKLPETKLPLSGPITEFNEKRVSVDKHEGALYTFLKYDHQGHRIRLGNINGELLEYNLLKGTSTTVYRGKTPITWYNENETVAYITEVGILDPSEQAKGRIVQKIGEDTTRIPYVFHRPTHSLLQDLNGDGFNEIVVSEFGNETGRLSMLISKHGGQYEKKVLLNLPGNVRTLSKDMDQDGNLDIITMTSQGNEGITIFYQKNDLSFEWEKVVTLSPVYGSSWFEVVDYNGDGFDDLVTVNGDNADKSYVHKPYHGMRIYLNDGTNHFSEAFFYPLNGATRSISMDFDQDGDIDFALVSSFPDYEKAPERSFVYLENRDATNFEFATKILKKPNEGRWFLMDSGDVDDDGDIDIILSSFTYAFTPVPENLSNYWSKNNVDLLILENKLY